MSTNEWPKIYEGSMGQPDSPIEIKVTMSTESSGTWQYLGRAPQPISISRSGLTVTLKNAEMELCGEEIDQHIKGIMKRRGEADGLFGLRPEKLFVGRYIAYTSRINTVGSGAFGHVWKCRLVQGPRFAEGEQSRYVAKYVELKTERDTKQVQREADVLSRIHHQNILPLEDFDVTSTAVIFVLPYLHHGNLSDVLRSVAKRSLWDYEASPTSIQILNGIEFLHAHEITHRDLKPQNILVSDYVEDIENSSFKLFVKVADFGCSQIGHKQPEVVGDNPFAVYGTKAYMAPEICYGMVNFGHALDYWSLGVLFYFLFNSEKQLPVPHLRQQDGIMYASSLTQEQLSSDINTNVPEGPFRNIVLRLLEPLSAEEWHLVRFLTRDKDEQRKVFEERAKDRMIAKEARRVLERKFRETTDIIEESDAGVVWELADGGRCALAASSSSIESEVNDVAQAAKIEQEAIDEALARNIESMEQTDVETDVNLRAEIVRRQEMGDVELAQHVQVSEDRACALALEQEFQEQDMRADSARRQAMRDEELARSLQNLEDRNFANALQREGQQSDRSRSRSRSRSRGRASCNNAVASIAHAARVGIDHFLPPEVSGPLNQALRILGNA